MQPWVHAILYQGKGIENRTWKTSYRGWLALHASASKWPEAEFPRGKRVPDLATLTYSAICGVARLDAVVTESRSPWFWPDGIEGRRFGWVLTNRTPLANPIPCTGARGLWEVLPADFRKIRKQLPDIDFEG